jgi:hypothetical protein
MAEVWDVAGIPEALIDGPPVDGELLLQRTLRRVRTERSRLPVARAQPVLMSVALTGARMSARITGIPAGRLCRLVAVTRTGERRPLGDRFLTEHDLTVERTIGSPAELGAVELTDVAGAVLTAYPLP